MAPGSFSKKEIQVMEECQEAIGYRFGQLDLLRSALAHASGVDSRLSSNERLEFLGDAILGLVCCEWLYLHFPEFQEGDMTKVKSVVVSRPTCAAISSKLNLGKYLFMGRGSTREVENLPVNVLADAFESLLGAIYLDSGFDSAREFALRHLVPIIDEVANSDLKNNAKSLLQQMAQKDYGSTPQYILLDENGPDHSKCFKMAAVVNGKTFPGAWAKNKKEAEQRAAMNALAVFQGQQPPFEH